MNKNSIILAGAYAISALSFSASSALAHVSITNDLYADSYSQIEFAVPHGCEGYDTVSVEISLPEELNGVRPLNSTFGSATVTTDENGTVTQITWTASAETPYESDSHAYSFAVRTKTPGLPFKTLYFPTVQICEDTEGNQFTSAWVGMGGHDHDAETDELPAPSAILLPKRVPGWNQYIVDEHVHELSVFNDAEIVWYGDAAYSSNAHTQQLIEEDATAVWLDQLHPGAEIWVKY